MKKQCSKCKALKDTSEFYRSKQMKDNLTPWCKDCQKKSATDWKVNNRVRYNVYMKTFMHNKYHERKEG